jgi:hypothetical protein
VLFNLLFNRALWTSRVTGVVFCIACCVLNLAAGPAEFWPEALSRMPLGTSVGELNRTNCVDLMLGAFQSNHVVKALIFMPAATDELYLFRRVHAQVTNESPTLLDAVTALTNQTFIRATFSGPFLLLHTSEDLLEPRVEVIDQTTAERIQGKSFLPHILCNDRDWDYLQPLLRQSLRIDIRPWRYSRDSWHFYRHSFAAWGLNGQEALTVAALGGKSQFSVGRKQVIFTLDSRVREKSQIDLKVH